MANVFKKKTRKKAPQGAPPPNRHINLDSGPRLSTVVDPLPAPCPEPEGSRSRSGRLRTFPSRYKDFLPAQTIPLAHAPQPAPHNPSGLAEQPHDNLEPLNHPQSPGPDPTEFTTSANNTGLFRVYPIKPTSDPDSIIGLEDVCESPHFSVSTSHSDQNPLSANGILPQPEEQAFYAPFTSPSIYRLMRWFFSGSKTKSIADVDSLINDVITASDFNPRDLVGVSAAKEAKRLDEYQGSLAVSSSTTATLSPSHGWSESSVSLPLPCERHNLVSESKAPTVLVSGLFHRDIVDIVITAFQDQEVFPTLHLTPYKEYRNLGEGTSPERVYGEMYSSDSFYDAWESVQNQSHSTGDGLEHIVVALMLWSDSTHLTNFGSASLWPVYLSLGNQSKYIRTKPSSFSHHHLVYMPSVRRSCSNPGFVAHITLQLPDDIQDAYMTIYQRAPSSAILTHLKRELIHAIYELILNSIFMMAYKDGIAVTCYDGIQRRLFVRLLTYSGDYPEKYVIFRHFMLCTYFSLECSLLASNFWGSILAHDVS